MLFDEVTSAFASELTGEVLKTIAQLAGAGMTMILVTHEMGFARWVATRTVFMNASQIWEEGPSKEIFANPRTPDLRNFIAQDLKQPARLFTRDPVLCLDCKPLRRRPLTVPTNHKLAEKLRSGQATFGSTFYTGSTVPIEVAGNWGLDFAFIDAEHTSANIDRDMEKLVLASLLAGIAPLVRVRGPNEWDIRKSLEFGATGVIVPQVGTTEQARAIVRAAKFPPHGRRGGDASCRAAGFAEPGFQWSTYMERENTSKLIIPMAESFEFFDNIDEILQVDGIDVINFGPADYSISRRIPIDYSMSHPEVEDRLSELIEKCHARGIKVMAPCIPPVTENVAQLKMKGVDMIIMGNDVMFLNDGFRRACEAIDNARKTA